MNININSLKNKKYNKFGFFAFLLSLIYFCIIFYNTFMTNLIKTNTILYNYFLIFFIVCLILVILSLKLGSKSDQTYGILSLVIIIVLFILSLLIVRYTTPIYLVSPTEVIHNKLLLSIEQPKSLIYTIPIKFSSDDCRYIGTTSLIGYTALNKDQLIFSNNNISDFEVLNNFSIMEIKTKQFKSYKLGVLCDENYFELQKSIKNNNLNIELPSIDLINNKNNTLCIVFPEYV